MWWMARSVCVCGGGGPKRPTNIGRIDSPQNLAETTQVETTRPKRHTAKTTLIQLNRIEYELHLALWRVSSDFHSGFFFAILSQFFERIR